MLPQAHPGASSVFRDEFHSCRFQSGTKSLQRPRVRPADFAFEIGDGLACYLSRCLQLILRPIQQSTSRTALRGRDFQNELPYSN
ncbi:hypothetical protein RMHFA_05206a (plasmid) [Roseomonas mucosa]|nr:hypothetical protein RMHFA_05206b [Roseomonas mucosa]UZO99446.1 hypothetical protein RMHFA_05206a [Roseomonas mucosa]